MKCDYIPSNKRQGRKIRLEDLPQVVMRAGGEGESQSDTLSKAAPCSSVLCYIVNCDKVVMASLIMISHTNVSEGPEILVLL